MSVGEVETPVLEMFTDKHHRAPGNVHSQLKTVQLLEITNIGGMSAVLGNLPDCTLSRDSPHRHMNTSSNKITTGLSTREKSVDI